MDLYVIVRRNGWATAGDLEQARRPARSTEGDKPDSGVRWIRSYVLAEESGELGTVLHLRGGAAPRRSAPTPTPPTCRSTRSSAVADTVVVRPDPAPVAA